MTPMPRLSNSRTRLNLPGAHRTEQAKGGRCYIRWRAWRGKGAPNIGTYAGDTWAEAEARERADEAGLSRRYGEAREHKTDTGTLDGVLTYYEQSGEFKRLSASKRREVERIMKSMRADTLKLERGECKLRAFPTAALGAKRSRSIFKAWRDDVCETRGPQAADARVEALRRALNVAMSDGVADANPLAKLGKVANPDRADLIWETEHQAAYFGWIAKERIRIEREAKSDVAMRQNKPKMLARLAAGEDALIVALWTGMRREDVSLFDSRWVQGRGVVYTASKGARRAKTAGKKPRITVVPILPPLQAVLDRRFANGRKGWLITSSRKARYTPHALGAIVGEIASEAGVDRTLHDAKGTFVTHMLTHCPDLSRLEIARMVDWSEDDVERIERKYVSGDRIAAALLDRLNRNGSGA